MNWIRERLLRRLLSRLSSEEALCVLIELSGWMTTKHLEEGAEYLITVSKGRPPQHYNCRCEPVGQVEGGGR